MALVVQITVLISRSKRRNGTNSAHAFSHSRMIAGMASGEPGWLASLDRNAANMVAGQGTTVAVTLAVVLGLVAAGVFLPVPGARAALILAVVVAAVIWVVGQNFGGILTGSGTDPNTGPLLILLAAAYWPATRRKATP